MRHRRWVFYILAIVILPGELFALGVRIADQDPFATARGNAFSATADNPSAIYYNPAGITQLEGLNARVGVYAITLGSTYTAPNGTKHDTRDEFDALPQLYATYAVADLPLSVGLGLYAPYGLGLEWPDDTGFRTLAKEGRITYLTFNPVIAWKVLPTLSIAAGPTVNYSQAKLTYGLLPSPGIGDQFAFKGDDTAPGFNAGVMWQLHPKVSVGATYRSETTLHYDGHSSISGLPPLNGSQEASAGFHFPRNIIGGLSYRPSTNWNFEVDVDWTDWDSLNTVTLKQASGNLALPFNWRSSFFYEAGATYYFGAGYRASAGYIYSENSVPDTSFSPGVPDSDRHIFSLGMGRRYKEWSWDAAYQLAWGPSRTVTGSPTSPTSGESANGRYEFISHALTISLGYTF
jgi:long-chain fatty acid transport protein